MTARIAARRQRHLTPPGQHVYAYCNVRTRQVLYSLHHFLNPKDLEQLPDVGANYKPPTLRKDSWRPLWSLTLPSGEHGQKQGLDVYKRLREYRILHETCWDLPSDITRPYTEKEIAIMKDKLENRGGSKKETVFDVIKREKHKMRQKVVMDQKANSIADLAAVLLQQEEIGAERAKLLPDPAASRQKETTDMISLAAEAENADGVRALQKQVKPTRYAIPETEDVKEKNRLRRRIFQLKLQIKRMEFARDAVRHARAFSNQTEAIREMETEYWKRMTKRKFLLQQEVKEAEEPVSAASAEKAALKHQQRKEAALEAFEGFSQECRAKDLSAQQVTVLARVYGLTPPFACEQQQESISDEANTENESAVETEARTESISITEPETASESQLSADQQRATDAKDASGATSPLRKAAEYEQYLPPFPANLELKNQALTDVPKQLYGWFKSEVKFSNRPLFTAHGVTVHWANMLDAEYAKVWPEDVQHRPLGAVRWSHPHPKDLVARDERARALERRSEDEEVIMNEPKETRTREPRQAGEAQSADEGAAIEDAKVAPAKTAYKFSQDHRKRIQEEILREVRRQFPSGKKRESAREAERATATSVSADQGSVLSPTRPSA